MPPPPPPRTPPPAVPSPPPQRVPTPQDIAEQQRQALIERQQRAVSGLNGVLQRPSLDDAHFAELAAAIEEADTVGVNVVEARAWLQKLKNQKSLEDEVRAANAKAAAAVASPPPKSPPGSRTRAVESAGATLAGASIQASTPRPKGPARAARAGSQPRTCRRYLSQRNQNLERPRYRLGFMNAGPELLSR